MTPGTTPVFLFVYLRVFHVDRKPQVDQYIYGKNSFNPVLEPEF